MIGQCAVHNLLNGTKANAHFAALNVNLFILKKRFEESFKMSVYLEDLDVDFVLQHFILCLFVNEDDDETEL